MPNTSIVIFSDLDGTLLDHNTYQFEPAQPILAQLRRQKIPVVLCSSKTKEEIEQIQTSLQLDNAFICENGAAIYLPKSQFKTQPEDTISEQHYWVKCFVQHRSHWQQLVQQAANSFPKQLISFSELSIQDLMALTHLSKDKAQLALQRSFGEPVHWLGNEKNKALFIEKIHQLGGQVLQGGRFLHVSGDCDKGKALLWLTSLFQTQNNQSIKTIALGDSNNDIAMLQKADYAVLIRSPVHDYPQIQAQQVYHTQGYGPEGWAEAISHFLINKTF